MSIRSVFARLSSGLAATASKDWFEPLRHAGILAVGRSGQGVLKLAAVAVAAQTLGASVYGSLVMINAMRKVLAALVFVRSTHLVMRYGAPALEADDPEGFGRTVAFGVWLDALSAVLATATVLAVTGWVGGLLNLPPDTLSAARVFGLCTVFPALTITAHALLQLFGMFRFIALQGVVLPGLQLAGGGLAFALEGGLVTFLVVWFSAIALARVCLLAACVIELRHRGLLAHVAASLHRPRRPGGGAWRYLFGVNAQASMRQVQDRGGVLAAGALFDPGAAALVQVARQLGGALRRPVKTVLSPAILPVLMRQTAGNRWETRRKTLRTFSLASLWVALGLVGGLGALGQSILVTLFGPSFEAAYWVMLIFAIGGGIRMATVTFEPLLASAGRVKILLSAQATALGAHVVLLFTLIPFVGVTGAALAEAFALALHATMLWVLGRQEFSR